MMPRMFAKRWGKQSERDERTIALSALCEILALAIRTIRSSARDIAPVLRTVTFKTVNRTSAAYNPADHNEH